MQSVPGALATGSLKSRYGRVCQTNNPVAIAPGTDLITPANRGSIGNWQLAIYNALSSTNSRQVMRVRFERGHYHLLVRHTFAPPAALRLEHAAIVIRDDADEFRQPFAPRNQNLSPAHAAGGFNVAKNHIFDCFNFFLVVQASELDHLGIAAPRRIAVYVEHIRETARHPSRKVSSSCPEYNHASPSHIFTAVIANSFDHDRRAAVAHAKPFARNTTDIAFAAGGSIERDVADDHIL